MGPFAAGRCSYRGAEMCSAFVVRPFAAGALLLQAILELLIRCRSSAPLRTARNARPQAAINRRRKEVSGGSNTQHQAPPGQSSRTDTISGDLRRRGRTGSFEWWVVQDSNLRPIG